MAVRIQTDQTLYLYEDEGDTIFPSTGAWTILWKYRHESDINLASLLAVLYGDVAATIYCGAYVGSDGVTVTLRGANGGAETASTQPFAFEVGREYNLGLQRNNSNGTVTLSNDGVPVLSMTFSPDAGTAGFRSLHFAGFGGAPPGHLDSTWARMRIWTAVLTEAEIRAEFRSATAVRTTSLHNDWPMEPGAGRFSPASGTTQALKIFPATSVVDGTAFGTGSAELIFRASGSGADQTLTATSISAAVPVSAHAGSPAGVVQGDLEELWVSAGVLAPAIPPTMAAPTGWTLRGSSGSLSVAGGAVNARIHLFQRIAPASPAAAVVNTGGPEAVLVYVRSSHSNPDPTTPFGQVIFNRGGPATSAVVTALTAARARSRLSVFVTQGEAQAIMPPSDMVERLDNAVAGISMADKIQSAAGSSGTKTFELPSSADFGWGFAEFYSAPQATARSAAASLASAVLLARSASVGAATVVREGKATSTAIAAAVRETRSAQSQLTAAVNQARAASMVLSLGVQAAAQSGTAADAVVQRALSAAVSVDLAVRRAESAATAVSLQVQAASQASTSVDLMVQGGAAQSVSVAVLVQELRQAAQAVTVAIQQARTAAVGLTAAVQRTESSAFGVTLFAQAGRSVGASIDLQVQEGASLAMALQAAVQFTTQAAASLSAAVASVVTADTSLSAAISLQNTLGAAVEAAVLAGRTEGLGLSLYVDDPTLELVLEEAFIARPAARNWTARNPRWGSS